MGALDPVVIVDALSITTFDRHRIFGGWLRWQIEKQSHKTGGGYYMNEACKTLGDHRESARRHRIVLPRPCGAERPRPHNALDGAADYLFWLDDDDYLHPNRVRRQMQLLEEHPDAPYVAYTAAFFLDMKTRRLCPYESGGAAPLALTMFRRETLAAVAFDESLDYGEDTRYMMLVEEKFGPGLRIRDPYMTVFGCHPYNTSREARANMVFSIPLDELREPLGWTERDDEELEKVVGRFR